MYQEQYSTTSVNCGSTPFHSHSSVDNLENHPVLVEASGLAVSFRLDLVRLHLSLILLSSRPSQMEEQLAEAIPGSAPQAGVQKLPMEPDFHLLFARADHVAKPSLMRASPYPWCGCTSVDK